jgi:hypothetical protein
MWSTSSSPSEVNGLFRLNFVSHHFHLSPLGGGGLLLGSGSFLRGGFSGGLG